MSVRRQDVVDVITSWKGLKESDGSFKPIIDIYNSIQPLPRGYTLKYTDAWSAGTVSAAYKQANADLFFPTECSCASMVTKAQEMGVWIENDRYTPRIADVCMFDWQDDGIQDDKFHDNISIPDHTGIVISVDKKSKTFVVMEGNNNNQVGSRTMSIGGRYIRGFISPEFDEDTLKTTSVIISSPKVTTTANTATVVSKQIVGRGTLSKVAAGSPLKLSKTPMYASASTKSMSCYKTGTYYIWSVDTVNGRIRITNAPSHVGVKGQVTGWIDVSVAIALTADSIAEDASATTPTYHVNAVYVVQLESVVRKGPGTGYDPVGYPGLTANAKKYDTSKTGNLPRNTKVTCLEVKIIGSNVWIRIPSGWIAAYMDKTFYVK